MSTPQSAIPKTLIYVRGSTVEQQNTLRAQEDQARSYAACHGLEVAHVTVDEGESAVAVDFLARPAVIAMLEKARETGATSIIITKLDRGFRRNLRPKHIRRRTTNPATCGHESHNSHNARTAGSLR